MKFQVRGWYYAAIFGITFAMACISVKLWPTNMAIWELFVALGIGNYIYYWQSFSDSY